MEKPKTIPKTILEKLNEDQKELPGAEVPQQTNITEGEVSYSDKNLKEMMGSKKAQRLVDHKEISKHLEERKDEESGRLKKSLDGSRGGKDVKEGRSRQPRKKIPDESLSEKDKRRIESVKEDIGLEFERLDDKPEMTQEEWHKVVERRRELEDAFLIEVGKTIKELEKRLKDKRDEYDRLFNGESVIQNLINKWFYESDTKERLEEEMRTIKNELARAKEQRKEVKGKRTD